MNWQEITFSIQEDILDKFVLAIRLTKDDANKVVERWMMGYIADAFAKVASEYTISALPQQVNKGAEGLKGKITDEMVAIAYRVAKKVFEKKMTRNEGKYEIERISSMNAGSAQDYITIFLCMMQGKVFHRTTNNFTTEYFLENIYKDYGKSALARAVEATERHIEYYNSLGYGQLKAKEELVKRLKEKYQL